MAHVSTSTLGWSSATHGSLDWLGSFERVGAWRQSTADSQSFELLNPKGVNVRKRGKERKKIEWERERVS